MDERQANNIRNWQRMVEGLGAPPPSDGEADPPAPDQPPVPGYQVLHSAGNPVLDDETGSFSKEQKIPFQVHGQYIVNQIKNGILLIDQQAASERILYERYLEALGNQPIATQTALFPRTIEFPPADAALLGGILEEVNQLGFDLVPFGGNAFVLHGLPADIAGSRQEEALLEKVLAQYKENLDLSLDAEDNLARAMARSAALRRGQPLSVREMQDLIDQLFACSQPYKSPSGRNCFIALELDELRKRFEA